jgi:hypothetical protein
MNAKEFDEMYLEAQAEWDEFKQEFVKEFLDDRYEMMMEEMQEAQNGNAQSGNAQDQQQPQLYGQAG